MNSNNTFITDLEVDSKVTERHIHSGLTYVSTVTKIKDDLITVKRPDNKTEVIYSRSSGKIIPKRGEIPDFQLEQYAYPCKYTPKSPSKDPDEDSEEIITSKQDKNLPA